MVRFKNRWLLVEFLPINATNGRASLGVVGGQRHPSSEHGLDGKKVYNALKQSVLLNFGDTGWGAVGLSMNVKYFSPMTNICIIRVGRDQARIAWGAVTLLTNVDGVKVVPFVVHVSGTIKHAQLAAITHNREVIARYRASLQTPTAYHAQDSYEGYLEKSTVEIEALQD
ncbi:hypothetical protein AMATHDRAFT_40386 [Amanita thiersii Skay4041]|uniref:Ribonuclease P/MRP protein subunit POP5 n=1 Tax=Amanita thiersii Skay4041 TaxID=703135 RepID=A0A2A9NTH6_9AGAR|nr:hypothetical protein AMATHDRAFT_40386 [Amanita thiersii Skay4041]